MFRRPESTKVSFMSLDSLKEEDLLGKKKKKKKHVKLNVLPAIKTDALQEVCSF